MDKEELKINCLICGNKFLYLGSHIYHKHKIKSKKYKEMFGLPHNLNLISQEVREKKQEAFNKNRNKYLKNLTGKKFKKGFSRHKNKFYYSKLEKENQIKTILNKKLKGVCPICKTSFKHLSSHLYNKHKLIKINIK